jgi:hypothetical protein
VNKGRGRGESMIDKEANKQIQKHRERRGGREEIYYYHQL